MINENKIMLYGDIARNSIYKGMEKVYNAVRITMGPAGRNVLIENELNKPVATKDGVTVASSIKLSDRKQDMGAQLIKSVSRKTADTSGDGTSTSTVLAFSLLSNGLEYLHNEPTANLIDYKRGMDQATNDVVKLLKEISNPVETREEIHKIAMISSNGDKLISDLVTEAVYSSKVESKDGTVSISTSSTFESGVDISDAIVINNGYGKSYPFVNRPDNFSAEYDNVRVLVFDGSVGNITPSILQAMSTCYENDEAFVIVANEFSNNAVLNLINNNQKNGLKSVVVESPDFGTNQKNVLRDIAKATGTKVYGGDGAGIAYLESLKYEDLGVAQNIQVFTDKTYLKIGLNSDHAEKIGIDKPSEFNKKLRSDIDEYSKGILKNVEKSKNVFEINQAKKRVENLSSVKSTIHLYAMTEVEVEEMKQRAEDAVFATTSALEEGYVIGGGVTLAKIAFELDFKLSNGLNEEMDGQNKSFYKGYQNVLNSIHEPLHQILSNAFHYPVLSKYDVRTGVLDKEGRNPAYIDLSMNGTGGFNVRTLEHVEDMIESGVIDPAKVLRCAIQNANSVSSVALTTECMIFSDAYYTEELSSKENHELMFNSDK